MVGASVGALFLGVMMLFLGLSAQRFQCDAGVNGECTVDGAHVFERSQIRSVRMDIERGSKNSKYGVVVIQVGGRADQRLMRVEPDQALVAMRSIQGALEVNAPIDIELHGPRLVLPFGVAGLVASVVLMWLALSKMGRCDLVVSQDGSTLDVRRSVFGLPLGTMQVRLDGVERVVIERGLTTAARFRRRSEPSMTPVARLRLDTRSDKLPLTLAMFPGHALHLRAASALRSALLLAPDEADDAELAAIPMRTTPLGQRIGFAWAGLTTGSMLGLALFGISLVLVGKTTMRGNIEGWVFAAGAIPGAIAGVAIVFHATRTRLPR